MSDQATAPAPAPAAVEIPPVPREHHFPALLRMLRQPEAPESITVPAREELLEAALAKLTHEQLLDLWFESAAETYVTLGNALPRDDEDSEEGSSEESEDGDPT